MPEYIVTFTSMVIEADDEERAIDRAGDFKGGGNWEAQLVDLSRPVTGHVATPEGVTFEPWADGHAVGFKVTHPDRPTRYVYLNPSGETDTGSVDDSDVFVYHGEHGDPAADQPVVFVNIWDKGD